MLKMVSTFSCTFSDFFLLAGFRALIVLASSTSVLHELHEALTPGSGGQKETHILY